MGGGGGGDSNKVNNILLIHLPTDVEWESQVKQAHFTQ